MNGKYEQYKIRENHSNKFILMVIYQFKKEKKLNINFYYVYDLIIL